MSNENEVIEANGATFPLWRVGYQWVKGNQLQFGQYVVSAPSAAHANTKALELLATRFGTSVVYRLSRTSEF